MNELKKNDFFATLVKNQDLSIADLRDNGITPENSALLSKNDYKSMPQVQEAFKDDNGKFDEYTNKWFFYEATYEITNNATFTMTPTGGTGDWVFGFIGFGIWCYR